MMRRKYMLRLLAVMGMLGLLLISAWLLLTHSEAATAYNNIGISSDANPRAANFDGGGASNSYDALYHEGFKPGATITSYGIVFHWPNVAAGSADNWAAAGQTIAFTGSGSTLAFLGAATNGPSSGTGTITYTDGATQHFTLVLSDWTLNGGQMPVNPSDKIAVSVPYRNTPTGKQYQRTYVFFTSVTLLGGKTTRSITLPARANQGQLHVFAIGASHTTPQPTPTPPPPLPTTAPWTTYLANTNHTGYNPAEPVITPAHASAIHQIWAAYGANGISVQPIVADSAIFWGSWDGQMHATSFSGHLLWHTFIGQTTAQGCDPQTVGVASTATFGMLGTIPAIFVGGGNATFYALNAQTGAIIWSQRLGASPSHFIWSSPVVNAGLIYVGTSSFGDCPLVPGQFLQLSATNGAILHTFDVMPNGCVGGGIWGSPTLDTATNIIYIATGNGDNCSAGHLYAYSVIALNAATLSPLSHWQMPSSQRLYDTDFGSTPTLFTATINGTARKMLGVAGKSGYYYAFDRSNIGKGPLWEQHLAANVGDCPQCGDGSISPSAFDGTRLYVGGGATTINGAQCSGSISALNPATGAYAWRFCTSSPVLGAISAVPGIVVAAEGSHVWLLQASNGARLASFTDTHAGEIFYGAPSIADGRIYVGNLDGALFAFGLY